MNKKQILTSILAGLVLVTCVSCKNAADEKEGLKENITEETTVAPEEPRFTLMEREYPVSFKDRDTEEVYVNGVIRKPSLVSFERVNSKVSKTINAVLSNAFDRNNGAADDLMDEVMAAFNDENFSAEAAMFPWSVNSDYELVRNDGKVVTVKENVEYFAGGTHSTVSTYYYNFDVNDGKQITQILYTEGNDEERDAADNLIFTKLKEKYGEDSISYEYVTSSFVETAVDTWYFTENGVNVYFNGYEITPDSSQTFEIEFSREELPKAAQRYFLD